MQFKSLLVAAAVAVGSLFVAGEANAITVTYGSISGAGPQYIENGVRHRAYYNNFSSTGHHHSVTNQYIWYHSSCCSNRARIDLSNGQNFSLQSLTRRRNGTSTWTAYNASGSSIGSVSISGSSGVYTFPSTWVNLSRVDVVFPSGQFGWDDLVVNTCTPVADAGGPYTVNEGGSVNLSAAGSAATGGSISSYNWDLDGGAGTGPYDDGLGVTNTFLATNIDGPSSATVGVLVSCSGVTDTDTASVTINNVAPTVSATIPGSGSEGTAVTFAATATDPGPDTLTYLWSFGDGNTSTQQNPTHTYADDSTGLAGGVYSVSVAVNDGHDTTTSTGTIAIANVAPTVATMTGPTQGDEGSTLTFAAAATDPGTVDAALLTYSWDWGDGTAAGAGTSPSHAWADDLAPNNASPYTVTLTVTDPQGATASQTLVVTIDNVAPTITSSAPPVASEGTLWSYPAAASDPGADAITWSLSASAPATMTVDPSTGLVEWTPDFADVGTASFTLTADDGDGDVDVQTVTIQVGFVDSEPDGMADTWETANGLDPTTDDSGLDPDGDGVTNLDEFLGGTDPNLFDGPDVPVQTSPIAGAEVDSARPTLVWEAANDPNGDALTYAVEVYADSGMATLLTSGSTADLSWQVDVPIAENADAYWRVQAADPYVSGGWSGLEAFFVNETNEAPGLPTAFSPVDGEIVTSLQPDAELVEATDIDRDAVGHRIRVWLDDTMVTEGWIAPGARNVTWTVDVELTEDTWYAWDAQAEDEHGLAGDWMEAEPFFVSTSNEAPLDVRFLDPLDGDVLESLTPAFEATESTDPEGSELTYVFELDTSAGFDSGALISGVVAHTGSGSVVFDLAAEGETLTEDTSWHARVRAEDAEGIGSDWDVIEVFIRGDNDAPPVPALISPEDGAVLDSAIPTVAVGHVEDPEGDTVLYSFIVARDAELTDVLGQVDGLVAGAGPLGTVDQTTWELTARVNGTFYWSAQAVDEHGAASGWAEPWSFSFDDSDPTRPAPDPGDCSCESSLASRSGASGLAIALLLIPALRRRRS